MKPMIPRQDWHEAVLVGLRLLSDLELQRSAWLEGEGACPDATELVCGLFDDSGLDDLLEEPGNATAYLAMNKVVNAWNLLDFTDEMTDEGTTMKPVYRDDAERSRMLALMRDAIGGAAFDNVHGSDMEALLEAFAELSPDRQRLVRARAKRCVKKGAALGEVDVRAVLEAGLTVKL